MAFSRPLVLTVVLAACGAPPTDTTDDTDDTDVQDTDVDDTDDTDADTDDTDADTDDTDADTDDTDLAVETDDTDDTDDTGTCLDVDTDAICDNVDLCEGDNSTGDHDTDGVCGDRDLCTGGDASGDGDADGVCDDVDQCVGDDALGDSDLDGSCDDLDLCQGDDATGDTDSDGTCDDLDACPGGAEDDADMSGWPDACEPVELGRWAFDISGYGTIRGEYAYVASLLEAPSSCPGASGAPAMIGGAVALADEQTGTFALDASNEPDFDGFVTCLTNGAADSYYSWGGFSSGPGQAFAAVGYTITETSFGATTDFAGHVVTRIDLEVTSTDVFVPSAGLTQGAVAGEWVIVGYALP